MKLNCYALICDSVGTMKLSKSDLNRLNEKLHLTQKILADKFSGDLFSDVVMSGGDGLEMLFKNVNSCAEAMLLISSIMFPFFVRFGVGGGSYSIGKSNKSSFVDCPEAFFKARAAINQAKQDNKTLYFYLNSFSDDSNYGILFESSFALLSQLTKHQRAVFNLFCVISPISTISHSPALKPLILQKFLESQKKELSIDYVADRQVIVKTLNEIKKREFELYESKFSFPPFLNLLVATICGTSRQNISKAKKSGNFDIIKSIQMVSLEMIGNE